MSQTELKFEVRNFIKEWDINTQQFADIAGMSYSALNNWLKNRTSLQFESLCKVKDALRFVND